MANRERMETAAEHRRTLHLSTVRSPIWSERNAMIRRLTAMTVALLAVLTGVMLNAGSASASVSTGPVTLTADQHLDSARAVLYMQYDGNLVLYKDGLAYWASRTEGAG